MRSKTNNGSNYEQRVLATIKEIKHTIEKDPHTGLQVKRGHFSRVVNQLAKAGIIINYGTTKNPVYSWQEGIIINDKLANKITAMVREYARKYYAPSKTAKMEVDVEKKSAKKKNTGKEYYSSKTVERIPCFFTSYSDQEIWDELKNRGYGIKDNRLCKVDVVYLD